MTRIIESKGKKYISDVLAVNNMNDLPDNCFLNKVTTGCGMTSAALAGPKRYVVCVPFQELVRNKVSWCNERGIKVLGVYGEADGGAAVDEIKAFTGDKIIVTWDSLRKLVDYINPKEWKILIDEAHQLVYSGSFRDDAIEQVLELYTYFGSFLFGTATPVKYQLPELEHINKVEIKWENLDIVNIAYTEYEKDLNKAVSILCINYLNGNYGDNNAHIFINSVKSITDIIRGIKKSGNSTENIRIICANTDRNKAVIKQELGPKTYIETVNSPIRKINFYTSTCFEGCDIFDSNAQTYLISDGGKNHTKLDILVTLPQIIGRIRNATEKNFINLWFTANRYYSHTTEAQFKEVVEKELIAAADIIADFNLVGEATKSILLRGAEENIYLKIRNGALSVNSTAIYAELNAFNTLHKTYYVSKEDKNVNAHSHVSNKITYKYGRTAPLTVEGLNKVKLGKKANFSMLCEEYFELKKSRYSVAGSNDIELINPLIKEAYDVLGEDKMRNLGLEAKKIEEQLVIQNALKSVSWKIAQLLDLRVGQWISSADLKDKIAQVYNTLKVNKKAKATDASEWFEIQARNKRIDGVLNKGFVIITSKYKK